MATIGVICAMPMELKPITSRLGLRRADLDGLPARAGSAGPHRVVAIVCGIGTELATSQTERLLDAVTVDRVVVAGITGALENETPIGALIVPEVVELGATGAEFRPDHLGDTTPAGRMWTTDVITPPDELPGLLARGVVSLDMETAAIAACCERRGIPWSVFRAISDRASDGSVDDEVFALTNKDGTPAWGRIARFAFRHPVRMARMAGLAKGAKLATERAAEVAIAAIATVPADAL